LVTTARRALSILLVDDDPGDVLMIREALEAADATTTVSTVNDGLEALAYLRRKPPFLSATRPDVMLLDLNMPRMNGHQVLAEVKADVDLRSIPVVILTTSQAPADIRASYTLHANAYVTKPINIDDLMDVVKRINDFFGRIAVLPE
jgi:CheY-like chemotaxis protein